MPRMPALVDEIHRPVVARPKLYELLTRRMRLAEVSAKPALSVVYLVCLVHRVLQGLE